MTLLRYASSFAGLLVALAPTPVLADPVASQPTEAAKPVEAAKPADAMAWTIVPVPIPWLAVGLLVDGDNLPLGPTLSDLKLLGGYFWSHDYAFDPSTTVKQAPGGGDPQYVTSDRWHATAEWDVHLGQGWTLGPYAELLAGGLTSAGSYDPTLIGGMSARGGPVLRYQRFNDKAFPTEGTLAELLYTYGHHWGGEALDFQKGGLNAVQYFPLARNQTVAVRGTVQAGSPKLAWVDKFSAGGGDFVRGYAWNRFAGDRLAAFGLEYRNLMIEDLAAMAGLKLPVALGMALSLHADAGRAWESRTDVGLPLGSDLRAGGGLGLLLTIDRAPLGRLELNGSSEGVVPVAELGTSF